MSDEARRRAANVLHWTAWAIEEAAGRVGLRLTRAAVKIGMSQAQRTNARHHHSDGGDGGGGP